MVKDIPISAVLSIVVGLVIILWPNLLVYLLGLYLIVTGLLTALNRK